MTVPGRGDGLIRPLNAPSGQQVLPGVQPGTTGGTVLAQYVIIFGQASGQQAGGMFIYEGSPGPGNPPVYSDSNATEDPYGNAIAAGIWAGQFGGIQVGLQTDQVAGTADIFWVPSSAAAFAASAGIFQTGGQAILQIFGVETTNNPAANSDYVALYLWDHGGATGPGASAALQGWFFDSTSGAPHNFLSGNYAGLVLPAVAGIAAVQPGTGSSPASADVFQPETWHPATPLSNSWAGSGGVGGLFYRATPDGEVELLGDIINATATGNSVCYTLPAGYRPATSVNVGGINWNNPQASNAASVPWLNVSTGGAIQVTGIEVADKEIFFRVKFPLGTL
jgi:hypothetical protein